MTPDRNLLKNLIAQAKTTDLLVLSVNSLDKNSYKNYTNKIEKFIKKSEDYVVMVIRR